MKQLPPKLHAGDEAIVHAIGSSLDGARVTIVAWHATYVKCRLEEARPPFPVGHVATLWPMHLEKLA